MRATSGHAMEVLPPGYELLGPISYVEVLARGRSVWQRRRLNRNFGKGHWRKMKGIGLIRFPSGEVHWAELHWFEAHGIGKREIKIKKTL